MNIRILAQPMDVPEGLDEFAVAAFWAMLLAKGRVTWPLK